MHGSGAVLAAVSSSNQVGREDVTPCRPGVAAFDFLTAETVVHWRRWWKHRPGSVYLTWFVFSLVGCSTMFVSNAFL